MDLREQSRALQAHLGHARRALAAGDRVDALNAVESALEIDPQFLAARVLREQLAASQSDLPLCVRPRESESLAELSLTPPPSEPHTIVNSPPAAAPPPIVATEGWARFEEKARQKRIDRRLAAVRTSLSVGSVAEARAALEEVRELAPEHPAIAALSSRLAAAANRGSARSAPGRWLAAAAAFALVVIGVSWIDRYEPMQLGLNDVILPADFRAEQDVQTTSSIETPPIEAPTESPQANDPEVLSASAPPQRIETATAGIAAPSDLRPRTDAPVVESSTRVTPAPTTFERPVPPVAEPPPPAIPPPPAPVSVPVVTTPIEAPPAAPTVSAALVPAAGAVSAPVEPASAAVVPTLEDEDRQIRQVLDRYRSAYERLDARSARQVWPAVNEAALARAFDGLQSQSVTFDACEIRIRGTTATAACSGSARYVPKVGSRFQRVEPRSWDFTLRKAGAEWKIEAARAER